MAPLTALLLAALPLAHGFRRPCRALAPALSPALTLNLNPVLTRRAASEKDDEMSFDAAFDAFARERAARDETAEAAVPREQASKGPREAPPTRRPRGRTADRERQRAAMIEQGPAAELKDLQKAPLFSWAQLDDVPFLQRMGLVYAGAFVGAGLPIALVTYPREDERLVAFLAGSAGATFLVLMLIVRLAVGWSYIKDRLESDVLDYEETGWYDGFRSTKSKDVANRDKLLSSLEVVPVLTRLTKAGVAFGGLFLASCLLLKVAAPTDPYAMFDPEYLETLSRDDDAAAEAQRAAASRGRPLYCDSRYYRTVAGASNCN